MGGLITFIILATSILTTVNAGNETIKRDGDYPDRLQFLLSKQGKDYYGNHGIRLNFLEASEYCMEFGMQLVSIDTRGLYIELMKTLGKFKNYGYWTSATLSGFPTMFAWGTGGKLLDSGEIPSWKNQWFEASYGVIIYNSEGGEYPTGLYVVKCKSKQPVICER